MSYSPLCVCHIKVNWLECIFMKLCFRKPVLEKIPEYTGFRVVASRFRISSCLFGRSSQ